MPSFRARSFDNVVNTEFLAVTFGVDRSAFVRCRRCSCIVKVPGDTGQLRGEVVADGVYEMIIAWISAQVREWQHHQREAGWGWADSEAGLATGESAGRGVCSVLDDERLDRTNDVLEREGPGWGVKNQVQPVNHVVAHRPGNAHTCPGGHSACSRTATLTPLPWAGQFLPR